MTLSALLLSTLAFDAAPVSSFDTSKLEGSAGIIIIKDPKKKKELKGSAGIIIIKDPKKKEN